MNCFAFSATEDLALSTCCKRPCCPSHRCGEGSIASGFTCTDHPFGMRYEARHILPSRKTKRPFLRRLLFLTALLTAVVITILLAR